jgi:putative flippase GtrA
MVVLPIVAKIGAVGVTFVWNYLTIRRFVFRQTNANET